MSRSTIASRRTSRLVWLGLAIATADAARSSCGSDRCPPIQFPAQRSGTLLIKRRGPHMKRLVAASLIAALGLLSACGDSKSSSPPTVQESVLPGETALPGKPR